jgi:hypothetical protein
MRTIMREAHHDVPPAGLGLASVALGAVGLMLFVLPIAAIPISAAGFVVGAVGAAGSLFSKTIDGRLAIVGTAVCALAVSIELAIAYAPSGNWGRPTDPATGTPRLPKRYIAPPARFRGQIFTATTRPIS